MKCCYNMFGGTMLSIDGDNATLKNLVFKEQCKMLDIVKIRFISPSIWRKGGIEIITNKLLQTQQEANIKKIVPYSFAYLKKQESEFQQFYQELLNELRIQHHSEGTCIDEWWSWL